MSFSAGLLRTHPSRRPAAGLSRLTGGSLLARGTHTREEGRAVGGRQGRLASFLLCRLRVSAFLSQAWTSL